MTMTDDIWAVTLCVFCAVAIGILYLGTAAH